MRCRKKVLAAGSLSILAVGIAMADSPSPGVNKGQINFTGEITTAPCSVDGSSVNQTVPLGSISTNVLSAAGAKSTGRDFEIKLTGCTLGTVKNAQVTFNATPDADDPSLIALTAGPSSAQNVAVGLYDVNSQKDLALGTKSDAIPIRNGSFSLPFRAFYKATKSAAVAGVANATAQFTVSYN